MDNTPSNVSRSITQNVIAQDALSESHTAFLESARQRLSTAQHDALEALLMGWSLSDAARLAGVSRMTVHRWMTTHSDFLAIYNQWLDEVRHDTRSQLASACTRAAITLGGAVAIDGKLAFQFLKHLGFLNITKAQNPHLAEPPNIPPNNPNPSTQNPKMCNIM